MTLKNNLLDLDLDRQSISTGGSALKNHTDLIAYATNGLFANWTTMYLDLQILQMRQLKLSRTNKLLFSSIRFKPTGILFI